MGKEGVKELKAVANGAFTFTVLCTQFENKNGNLKNF